MRLHASPSFRTASGPCNASVPPPGQCRTVGCWDKMDPMARQPKILGRTTVLSKEEFSGMKFKTSTLIRLVMAGGSNKRLNQDRGLCPKHHLCKSYFYEDIFDETY